jgi:hypothetical protein
MATFEQSRHGTVSTTDQTLAFSSNVKAGSLLVVGIRESATPSGNPTITDSLGNTYTLAQAFANQFVYYTKTASAGACTVTLDAVGSNANRMVILEFSGTFGAAPFHTAAAGVDQAFSPITSNAVTPSAANGVMIALCANNNTADGTFTVTGGSGYTLGPVATGGSTGRVAAAFLTFTSAASYSVTMSATSIGNNLRIQNIAFVESGGGGGSAIAAISSGYHVRNINR